MSNTVFPTSLDPAQYDPQTTDTLASASHHTLHGFANDAIIALETKLGYGASLQTPTNGSLLAGTASGQSQWVTSLTSFKVTTSFLDTNGLTWISQTPIASAVNYVDIANAASAGAPTISAKGTDTNIDLNLVTKGSGKVKDNGSSLLDFRTAFFDFIQSGLVWTAGAGLVASMSAGTVWIAGVEYAISAINSHTFGASVDTYVDYTVGTGITYIPVANNAASPALAANSIRIAIVVTGTVAIQANGINQGQESMVLPIASSIPYAVTDYLGNLIYPLDINRRTLGYRQIISDVTTTSASPGAQVTGLTMPIIVPTNRKIDLEASLPTGYTSGANLIGIQIWDGVVGSGTKVGEGTFATTTANNPVGIEANAEVSPVASSKTYNVSFYINGGSTYHSNSGVGFPSYIKAKLA